MSVPNTDEFDQSIQKVQVKIKQLKTKLTEMKDSTHSNRKRLKTIRKKSGHQQDLLGLLNAEYEKLRQLRLDQCISLKSQWDNYQDQQRKNRKKEIQKRQVEFDKELEINDKERRKHWKVTSRQDIDKQTKKAICDDLLQKLSAITSDSNETEVQNLSVSQENEDHNKGQITNSNTTTANTTTGNVTTTSTTTTATTAAAADNTNTGVDTNNATSIQVLNNTQNNLNIDTSVLSIPIPLLESFWILDIIPPVTLSDVQPTIDSIVKLKESE